MQNILDGHRWIKGYENLYSVSSGGKVYSYKERRYLKPDYTFKGYLRVDLYNRTIRKHKRLHRLVAEAFIPNPCNYPQVNHLDGDKNNNTVSNLEWCTNLENNRHARKLGLYNKKKNMV